jgi:hypothetical protein
MMLKQTSIAAGLMLFSSGAFAQTDTTLNGLNLTGAPPTGYAIQPLRFGCISSSYCWPYMQMWDGATKVTLDPISGGLKVLRLNGGPLNSYATLPVTSSTSNVALPAGAAPGSTIVIYNNGPNQAYYQLGNSSVTASSSNDMLVPYGGVAFTVQAGSTNIAAVTRVTGQTASLNISLWSGAPASLGGPVNTATVLQGSIAGAVNAIGGVDATGVARALQATIPGTPATNYLLGVQGAPNGAPIPIASVPVLHTQTSALSNSLIVKASAGSLSGFNCSAITGLAAGYCVVINSVSVPVTGTAILPIDFCQFDGSPRGCSLGRAPTQVSYSTGITILVTTNASPYTYTSGTDMAAISADYQ